MDSSAPPTIQVIKFSEIDLIPGSCEWNSVKTKVLQALREFGCFEALFNKIPSKIQEATFEAVEQLFDLPLEVKKLHKSNGKPFKGYSGISPWRPLLECITVDDAHILENVESLTNTYWPQGNPSFSTTIQSFAERVSELDQIIRRMILESYGLEKYIDEHMNSTQFNLRIHKYKAPQTTAIEFGLKAHKDHNIITILSQNQVDGLEIQSRDGEWIRVKPSSKNSYIVLTGASFYAWLNGRLPPANHRVTMTRNEDRYSIGFFSAPKPGYIVKAPEEVCDEKHPLLFKPFDFAEYLKFLITEAGQRTEYPLEAYCGVQTTN